MNNPATVLPKKDLKVKTPGLAEDQRASIAKEIDTIVRNFLFDVNYETEVALRADVDGFLMAGDGKILCTDFSSLKEYMRQAFLNFQKFTEMKIDYINVYVLSADAACCTFDAKGKYLTKTGETIIHNACWTFVFKKFDYGWKVVQENGTHTH